MSNQKPSATTLEAIEAAVGAVADFPIPGIIFRDVTTLLEQPALFRASIDAMADLLRPLEPDFLAAVEARGFLFATALAYKLGLPVVPVRKPGKLPRKTIGIDYELEYGTDRLELHEASIRTGQRAVIIDDLLATGGTALATANLLRLAGAEVTDAVFLITLSELPGRQRLNEAGVRTHQLLTFGEA